MKYFGGSLRDPTLKEGSQIQRGILPKKGVGLGQFADLRGGAWQKRVEWYFWEVGLYSNAHYEYML